MIGRMFKVILIRVLKHFRVVGNYFMLGLAIIGGVSLVEMEPKVTDLEIIRTVAVIFANKITILNSASILVRVLKTVRLPYLDGTFTDSERYLVGCGREITTELLHMIKHVG